MSREQHISFWAWAMMLVGLFTFDVFRALPAIGMGLLVLNALLHTKPSTWIQSYTSKWVYIPFGFFVFFHSISFIQTEPENLPYFIDKLLLRLPLLGVPFALSQIKPLPQKQFNQLWNIFIGCVVLTATGSLINYALHFEEITKLYAQSKVMPVVVRYVVYSMLVAAAIVATFYKYLATKNTHKTLSRIYLFTLIYLTIFIHILSVRCGILALYMFVFCFTAQRAWVNRKFVWIILVTIGLIAMPILSYYTIPSVRNKVKITMEDLSYMNDPNKASDYPLTGRILSYQIAWGIFEKDPLIGPGIGNFRSMIENTYITKYPQVTEEKRLLPHNQYLMALSAYGIIGLLVFMASLYIPLVIVLKKQGSGLVVAQYILISASFLFEATLETQPGSHYAFFLLFLAIYEFESRNTSKRATE